MIGPRTILRRAWSISHELPESGETVLFDAARSELIVLNSTAGAVWALLDGQRNLEGAIAFVRDELPSAPPQEELLAQLVPFLRELLERGAVEIAS